MNGNIYSNMPNTTSRVAPYRRSLRRLAASALLFSSSLLLVASMGFAQDLNFEEDSLDPNSAVCEDFDSPEEAAEVALDDEDTFARLDSDGNGVVCDEDPELFANDDDDFDNDNNFSSAEDQYENDSNDSDNSVNQVQNTQQTPPTGGIALLPLAGSVLTAVFGGSMLIRRK